MALNIRPPSATASSSSSKSSSRQASSTDLFAQGLAAAAKAAQKAAANKAATPASQPKHTTAAKPAAGSSKPAPAKPKAHDSDDDQKHSAGSASKSSAAGKSQANTPSSHTSAAQAAADAQSGQDADQAQAATNADGTANVGKGRAPTRTATKNIGAQTAATKAQDAGEDSGTDSTNQSGLSLIEMLAETLEGSDAAPETDSDTATSAATAKSDDTDAAGDDPNAIALAMFSQALAAALGTQPTPPANVASASTGDTTSAIADATRGRTSEQDLMSALAHDLASSTKGKSDDAAAQFNVDPTNSSAGTTAVGQNAAAHLGIASQFAAQHLRNDTNTGELKSLVGSSDWNDELGTHLTWMTQKGLESGSLRVSPEHLGPVEVTISVQNGDASVWFAANHPDTRAALEQALPQLRQMFAGQGMNLADSGVSRQPLFQQGSGNKGRQAGSQSVSGVSGVGGADAGSGSSSRVNLGLVDFYA